MINICKVLYPTDFSELSEAALNYALHFARDYEATLHVIHVVDEAYQYWMNMVPNTMPVGVPPSQDVMKGADETLRKFVDQRVGGQVPTVVQVLAGRPWIEIVRYADSQGVDLVVIGTHGRGGLTHMLLGSVAEKVVRKAPCPVLTVHHPEREFILP
ncbi:MAG: hypothetical protein BIFFINMI_01171 [Phycisphaerae bacterium]|nr:hypothetical protein [Phycisphaerae bacterium]